MIALVLLAAAAQLTIEPVAEQKRVAREIVDQLFSEAEKPSYFRGYNDRDHVSLSSRPRASNQTGLCERDILSIERATENELEAPIGGTIREVKVDRWFYVLSDDGKRPSWDVRDATLERRCAQTSPSEGRWFPADDALVAKAAVSGLFSLRNELRKAKSKLVSCSFRTQGECPKFADLAERIDPLDPGFSVQGHRSYDPCPDDSWCVGLQLANPGCGGWATQLRMGWVDTNSFKSASINRFVGALHCGEQAAELEMLELEEATTK